MKGLGLGEKGEACHGEGSMPEPKRGLGRDWEKGMELQEELNTILAAPPAQAFGQALLLLFLLQF